MASQKFNAVMLDLEFLNNTNSSIVLSCGMTAFNKDTLEVGKTYGFNFDVADGIKHGLTLGADTLRWWVGQDQKVVQEAFKTDGADYKHSLEIGMVKIQNFIGEIGSDVEVWTLGSLDTAILRHIAEKLGRALPWDFRKERDLRTVREMFGAGVQVPDVGKAHNAKDDSLYQTNLLIAILKKIRGVKDKPAKATQEVAQTEAVAPTEAVEADDDL